MNYATVDSHRSMITDNRRNSKYAAALKKFITPDSVVLDLGAGLGILGLLAAKLGAKRVYLVEPLDIINIAKQITADNSLQGRITAIQGVIEEISLPEPVDIIISVFTGNFLFTEDLLPTLFYARDHYLKPGGTLIPDTAQIFAAPIAAVELYNDKVGAWADPQQGLDFERAVHYAINSPHYPTSNLDHITYLADPKPLQAVNFYTAKEANCKAVSAFSITRSGLCHGILGWMRIRLADEWLSTAPFEPKTHWKQVYFPVEPIQVSAGDELTLKIRRPTGGEWTWEIHAPNEKRVHSTFFALPISKNKIREASLSYQPALNEKGAALRYLLGSFDGQNSVSDIADDVRQAYPNLFSDEQAALKFVRAQITGYTKSR